MRETFAGTVVYIMYAPHLCALAGTEPVRDSLIASVGHLVTVATAITWRCAGEACERTGR